LVVFLGAMGLSGSVLRLWPFSFCVVAADAVLVFCWWDNYLVFGFIVLLFYCFIVLLFYSFIVLLVNADCQLPTHLFIW